MKVKLKKGVSNIKTSVIAVLLLFLPTAIVSAQITISVNNKEIREIIPEIEKKSHYGFFYSEDFLDLSKKITFNVSNETLENILKTIFKGTEIRYVIDTNNKQISLSRNMKPGSNSLEKTTSLPQKQTIKVTGIVTDERGEPVIGASVVEKGTTNGVQTGLDGTFVLEVTAGAVMRITSIGFAEQEIKPRSDGRIVLVLREVAKFLDELVVIGYGSMKRADITTAVSIVDTEDLDKRPIIAAAQALQGKAAGVNVVQPSGEPGAGMTIRVRGATSVQASNEPLYVVDGIPTNNISDLSPNDIESMQILKDASSAAIYGARAANGVVLITTKRGQIGEMRIKLSAYTGVSSLGKKINALNTDQYKELMKDMIKFGVAAAPNIPDDEHRYTDWTDKFFRTGFNQNYQASISRGTENMQYSISGGYSDEQGIVRKARFNRYNFRSNIDSKQNDWLHIGLSLSYSKTKGQWVRSSASALRSGSILSVINTPPFMQEWDPNTPAHYDEFAYGARIMNPLAANAADNITSTEFLKGAITFTFDIYEGLKLKSTFGTDIYSEHWNYYLDPVSTQDGRSTKGRVEESFSRNGEWLLENILTYERNFDKHSLGLMGGAIQQRAQYNGLYVPAFDMSVGYPNLHSINAANQIDVDGVSSPASAWSLASFLGRMTYSYDSKYLLTMNFRSDGSSRFAPGHRWGYFPSVSAGWRISAEEFMSPLRKVVDDMKLRIGYGMNGNQGGIGNYSYLAQMGATRVAPTTENQYPGQAFWINRAANTELTWEKTSQFNAGIDLLMLNSRININLDAYIKKTTDLLLDVTLPANISGLSGGFVRNDGEMLNKGVELLISSKNLIGDFRWNTDFNISTNQNNVSRLGLAKVYYYAPAYATEERIIILKEGVELGTFFGYIAEGVDPETGNMIYKDLSENGSIGPEDRTIIGSAQPDFIYGLTNTFSYKNFTLSLFLQGSQGNDIFNASKIDMEGMMDFRNQSVSVINRWRRPGMETRIPRPGNAENIHNSTRFVEDGSYMRIKNVTLTYDFPPALLKKINFSKLQIYASAQNLLTFTNYSGYDPEVNAYGGHAVAMGVDYGTYPQSKSVVFGFNVEF